MPNSFIRFAPVLFIIIIIIVIITFSTNVVFVLYC